MNNREKIIATYNQVAQDYNKFYAHELEHKHLDKLLLSDFASVLRDKGEVIDLGCGPGHISAHLAGLGLTRIQGVDISPRMIDQARQLLPGMRFEVADMLNLPFASDTFSGAIAFYSIVHLTQEEISRCFREAWRVLEPGGHFLLSFHLGDTELHCDLLLDHKVDIDFYFFNSEEIIKKLKEANFKILDAVERHPYPEVEYQSKRCYLWAVKAAV